MIRATRWMARWSSAIRIRDTAIRLLQDRNRMLAAELALMHGRKETDHG